MFGMLLRKKGDYIPNSIKILPDVMGKQCVLSEVGLTSHKGYGKISSVHAMKEYRESRSPFLISALNGGKLSFSIYMSFGLGRFNHFESNTFVSHTDGNKNE